PAARAQGRAGLQAGRIPGEGRLDDGPRLPQGGAGLRARGAREVSLVGWAKAAEAIAETHGGPETRTPHERSGRLCPPYKATNVRGGADAQTQHEDQAACPPRRDGPQTDPAEGASDRARLCAAQEAEAAIRREPPSRGGLRPRFAKLRALPRPR